MRRPDLSSREKSTKSWNGRRYISLLLSVFMFVFCNQGILISFAEGNGEPVPQDANGYYYLLNEPLHSIKLKKTDAVTGEYLRGAVMELFGYASDGEEVRRTAASDRYGTVLFANLKSGVYTVKETTAPAHYELDEREHVVLLDENGVVTCDTLCFSQDSDFADYLEFPDERLLEGTMNYHSQYSSLESGIWGP